MGWMVKAIVLIGFVIQVIISHESELGGAFVKERITGWEPSGKILETTGLHGEHFPVFCLVV